MKADPAYRGVSLGDHGAVVHARGRIAVRGSTRAPVGMRGRTVDLFANTMIAHTLRWLVDVGIATQADFMREYHARSKRKTATRSSFANNVKPYTWGEGHVVDVYDAPNRRGVVARHVRWVGPSPDEILRSMTDKALDRAFAVMESRLTDDREFEDARIWTGRIRTEIQRRVP